MTVTENQWAEIESKFRVWSFGIYYHRMFAGESDLTLRFAKALLASLQPIRDRKLLIEWYHRRRRRRVLASC